MSGAPSLIERSLVEEEEKKGGFLRSAIELVVMFVIILAITFGITNYVVTPYQIPSESMTTTILEGDRVLSEKVSYYGGSPEPGQIVTFNDVDDEGSVLIKRCIATAGQTVDLRDGEVYVDGQRLEEPYTQGRPSYDLESDVTYPHTVAEGCIWVMGDNRTNSLDSRWFGDVPLENVTGHAFFRYWPIDRIGGME